VKVFNWLFLIVIAGLVVDRWLLRRRINRQSLETEAMCRRCMGKSIDRDVAIILESLEEIRKLTPEGRRDVSA